MKKTIVAAFLAIVSIGAHADALSDAVAAQDKAVSNISAANAKAANVPEEAAYIRVQAPLLVKAAVIAWFTRAKAAGIKFDQVGRPNLDADQSATPAYGGKILYMTNYCNSLACVVARVQPSGAKEPIDIELSYPEIEYYSIKQIDRRGMDGGCVVYGGDYAWNEGTCGDLLDKSKRAANIETMVTNLNTYLAKVVADAANQ